MKKLALTAAASLIGLSAFSAAFAGEYPGNYPDQKGQFDNYSYDYQHDLDNNNDFSSIYFGVRGGLARANFGDGGKDFRDFLLSTVDIPFDAPNAVLTTTASDKKGNFTFGGILGYQFNKYFAIEASYDYFSRNRYNGHYEFTADEGDESGPPSQNGDINIKENTQAISLVGKGILPLGEFSPGLDHFNLFAKAGAAYVISDVTGDYINSQDDTNKSIGPTGPSTKISKNAITPTYGAGIQYNVNKNFNVEAAWTQIYGKSTSVNDIGNKLNSPMINSYTLGITYHIPIS